MDRERILVTGGAGFIGSHLVDRLVANEMEVTVIDNLNGGAKKNLSASFDRIRFVEGDVRDQTLVNELVPDADIVFHLAANASVPNSVNDPRYDFETNVIGTFNLLNASIDCKLKKIVYASSAAVYGDSRIIPIKEHFVPNPVSPYGTTKLCGEILGLSFKRTYGVPLAIARIFNVYGPRLPRYVIYDFYRKLRENPNELEILGDGEQSREFCYVSDAVDALLLIAEKGEEIYNVAGIEQVRIKKLAEIMISKLAPNARIVYTGKSWPGDIKNLIGDITKLRKLGFEPKVDLDEGIELTIKWFDENLTF